MTQPFPVTRSIVSAQALRDVILPHYTIGTVTDCIFHTLGVNDAYEVRSLREADVAAIPLFVCVRYIWHMGPHTANANDWGHAWLNDEYFDKGMQNLRKCAVDYHTL